MTEAPQYRFLIKSASNGSVELAWSQELNHHPVAVGTVYVTPGQPAQETLAREALAYLIDWQRITGRRL